MTRVLDRVTFIRVIVHDRNNLPLFIFARDVIAVSISVFEVGPISISVSLFVSHIMDIHTDSILCSCSPPEFVAFVYCVPHVCNNLQFSSQSTKFVHSVCVRCSALHSPAIHIHFLSVFRIENQGLLLLICRWFTWRSCSCSAMSFLSNKRAFPPSKSLSLSSLCAICWLRRSER